MTLAMDEWLRFIDSEYFAAFVPTGGAAVKIAVGVNDNEPAIVEAIASTARKRGFVVATIDSTTARVDRIDQLFLCVARQVDWRQLSDNVRERAVRESGYTPPTSGPWTFADIGQANGGVAAHFVRSTLERWFTENVFGDHKMSQDFRMAMSRLCFEPMVSAAQDESPLVGSIVDWLRGELRLLSAVRPAAIYQKVARHNARDLLLSLAHWTRVAGREGLVVIVDIRAVAVRSRAAANEAHYYTRAAAMDLYEVLRQFIDSTDQMDGCFIAAVASPDFITDEQRGLDIYQALKMRVADEVRAVQRDNPMASLVRLGT